jgi:hypothetical protein
MGSQGLSSSTAAGNSTLPAASSLNFAGKLPSEPTSPPALRAGSGLSMATAETAPSVSSVSGVSIKIIGGDHTAPLTVAGTTIDVAPQETITTTLPTQNVTQAANDDVNDSAANRAVSSAQPTQPEDAAQKYSQSSLSASVVQTVNVAAPSGADVAANEVPLSPAELSSLAFPSLALQDSGARTEIQQSGSSVAVPAFSSILSTAPSANAPTTHTAAMKASLPTIAPPGAETPPTSSAIPMQGAPAKAIFPGTVVPQGTPKPSVPVTSIPKSVSVTSGSTTPSDLSAAIQTHVANTLAGSSLELHANVTLAVGQSLDGIQSKTSALSPAVAAANAQLAKPLSAAVTAITPNGETAAASNQSAGNSLPGSARNVATGKDSTSSTPSVSGSAADAQVNQSAAIAAQIGTQTSSPQATAAALAVPMSQNPAGQPAPATASARPANENLPSGASNSPSNPAATSELPPVATVGPVQVAQIASKAAQTEMRIGMNTSAFGSVEVRTTVHANDVGVVIGSEKGDLRSLMSNELPGIANTLQQQNLRLNQVSFQQGAAFLGNSFSGNSSPGNGSQQNLFSSPQTGSYAGQSTEMVDDSPLMIESASGSSTSLSILA